MLPKYQKVLAWIVGASIVGFGFRNPFNQLALIVGAVACINILIPSYRKITLGSKFIYIPLLVVLLSIVASCFVRFLSDHNSSLFVGNAFMAVYFFAVYLVVRMLGKDIFKPFAWAVVIESISIIIYGIIKLGVPNGGLASLLNYNLAAGILIFGVVASYFYGKWWVVGFALSGLFFAAPEEAVGAVAVILVAMIIRKDWTKKLLIPVGAAAVVAVAGIFPFSYTKSLYERPIARVLYYFDKTPSITDTYSPPTDTGVFSRIDYILDGRLTFIRDAMINLKPLGTGYVYYPDLVRDKPIHNVPLVIVQQVGIVGALAWCFMIVYCLVKTQWKYAFLAVIGLGLSDNFIFCQLGLSVYALVGVASLNDVKTDLFFRRV